MLILTDTALLDGETPCAIFDNVLAFHLIQLGLQNGGTPHFVEKTTPDGVSIVLYTPTTNWKGSLLTGSHLLTYHRAKKMGDRRERRAVLQMIYEY